MAHDPAKDNQETDDVHVGMICGECKGGLRRHVHDLMFGLTGKCRFSYMFAEHSREEAAFQMDFEPLQALTGGRCYGVRVRKMPHLSDISNMLLVARLARSWECQVLHGHGAKGGLYARLAGILTGIPVVYTPHGGSMHDTYSVWEKMIYTRVERWLANVTDCFLFESEYSARQFHRKIGTLDTSKVIINPNAIRFQHTTFQPPASTYDRVVRFGVFGMLREIKGQRVAINAFRAALKEGVGSAELHFFGDGEDSVLLKRMASDMPGKVLFHGNVADVYAQMSRMDVIVVPSLVESFSYTALEAVYCQRYVIGSSVGVLPQLVSSPTMGHLLAPGDETGLTNALVAFCRNPVYPPGVDPKIRATFEFDRFLDRTYDAYAGLISSPGRGRVGAM